MSNTFPFSPKAWVLWRKNVGKAIGTGFRIGDCYNRIADKNYKRVAQKRVNQKELRVTTKKLEEKSGGIENPELADAVKVKAIKEECKKTLTEYAQTNMELGYTCKDVLQDAKSAKALPQQAETASLYHIAYSGNLPRKAELFLNTETKTYNFWKVKHYVPLLSLVIKVKLRVKQLFKLKMIKVKQLFKLKMIKVKGLQVLSLPFLTVFLGRILNFLLQLLLLI